MRPLLLLACCVCWAGSDGPQLRKQYDAHRMFELRRALKEPSVDSNAISFYRAVVEARFGREEKAVDSLHRFLETHPDSDLERKANQELAGAFERLGRYGDAAEAWSRVIKQTSAKDKDRADQLNTQQLDDSLRDVPRQSVRFGEAKMIQATRNGVGTWNVPVEVNGTAGEWIFDTGANISTITESEARRMKLMVRDSKAYVSGSTGKKNPLRLAIANELRLGGVRLSNVVFLVLNDQALHIGPIKYQINGIVGLPVLRLLGRVTMSAEGAMRVQATEPMSSGEPNLFFEELTPMVAAGHRGRELQLFLDTGNNTTFLYPSSRQAFSGEERANLIRRREQMGGAGGVMKHTVEVIPSLTFEILGSRVELKALSLLSKQPKGELQYRDGVFGADVLANGFTIDFGAMEFRIQLSRAVARLA